jgi:hypothetical protein
MTPPPVRKSEVLTRRSSSSIVIQRVRPGNGSSDAGQKIPNPCTGVRIS